MKSTLTYAPMPRDFGQPDAVVRLQQAGRPSRVVANVVDAGPLGLLLGTALYASALELHVMASLLEKVQATGDTAEVCTLVVDL